MATPLLLKAINRQQEEAREEGARPQDAQLDAAVPA